MPPTTCKLFLLYRAPQCLFEIQLDLTCSWEETDPVCTGYRFSSFFRICTPDEYIDAAHDVISGDAPLVEMYDCRSAVVVAPAAVSAVQSSLATGPVWLYAQRTKRRAV